MSSPDLDLDWVRCFVAVAECGGFTAAGKHLNLTQSAVSLKIGRLETFLGRRVFTRTSRSLELTGEGELLWSYARRLLALSEEMMQRITAPAVAGLLNLGVAESFVPERLPGLISSYAKAHPNVRLNVEVGTSRSLFLGLEEGRLDLIIATAGEQPVSGKGSEAPRDRRLLRREPLVWVKGESLELPGNNAPIPLALLPLPCNYRLKAIEALERVGRAWQIIYSSASLASIQLSVQAGFAVTVLRRSSVISGMQILTPDDGFPSLPESEVAIFSRQSLDQPLVKCLSKFFAEALGN